MLLILYIAYKLKSEALKTPRCIRDPLDYQGFGDFTVVHCL